MKRKMVAGLGILLSVLVVAWVISCGGGSSSGSSSGFSGMTKTFHLGNSVPQFPIGAGGTSSLVFSVNLSMGLPGGPYTYLNMNLEENLSGLIFTPAGVPAALSAPADPLGGLMQMTIYVDTVDAADPCATGIEYGPFTITLAPGSLQPANISPETASATQSTLDIINIGAFTICVQVQSPAVKANASQETATFSACAQDISDMGGTWTGTYYCTSSNPDCATDESPVELYITQAATGYANYTDDGGAFYSGNVCGYSFSFEGQLFAAAGYVVEPTFDELVQIMEHFRSMKPVPAILLQLSGGEPTVRNDLPDIIRKGKELGFTEVMVTTNGVRFGKSIDFMKKCKDAGMDAIYLQFDATDNPEVWKKVRGVNLWPLKKKVIENARKIGLYGIMLVPTIAKGVNDKEVGNILNFAKDNADVISGIIFQPVSLCGRISFEELMDLRYTTSDLKIAINEHTNDSIKRFYPIATTAKMTRLLAWFDDKPEFGMTSSQDCGFATILVINEKNEWEGIENYFDAEGLIRWANKVYDMVQKQEVPQPTSFLKGMNLENLGVIAETVGKFVDDMTNLTYRQMMKAYFFAGVARYVKNPQKILTSKTYQAFAQLIVSPSLSTAGNFLHSKNLMISAMHFQDSYNFDLDRVCKCLVHYGVIDPEDHSKVREIPFCSMNTLHRPNIEKALAIQGEEAKNPELIQAEIEELLETVQKE